MAGWQSASRRGLSVSFPRITEENRPRTGGGPARGRVPLGMPILPSDCVGARRATRRWGWSAKSASFHTPFLRSGDCRGHGVASGLVNNSDCIRHITNLFQRIRTDVRLRKVA